MEKLYAEGIELTPVLFAAWPDQIVDTHELKPADMLQQCTGQGLANEAADASNQNLHTAVANSVGVCAHNSIRRPRGNRTESTEASGL